MKSDDFRREIRAWRQMESCREYFFADLIKATSALYDIPVSTLVSHHRDREITKLRWRVYWIGRTELGLSYTGRNAVPPGPHDDPARCEKVRATG